MFVNSPNQPLEFAAMRPDPTFAAPQPVMPRRRHRARPRRVVPNVVRLIPGMTRLPLGSDRQAA
jgi:hypothetical protein